MAISFFYILDVDILTLLKLVKDKFGYDAIFKLKFRVEKENTMKLSYVPFESSVDPALT